MFWKKQNTDWGVVQDRALKMSQKPDGACFFIYPPMHLEEWTRDQNKCKQVKTTLSSNHLCALSL